MRAILLRCAAALGLMCTAGVLPLAGQALRIEGADRAVSLDARPGTGVPRYGEDALAALGASFVRVAGTVRVALHGDTLVFRPGSPFFLVGRTVHQLVEPVTVADGRLQMPLQFFAEWLPLRWPERFSFAGATLRTSAPLAAPPASTAAQPRGRPKRVVVVDPGHGGRDPGRIGPNGLREKDATLAFSVALARLLEERGYEVHLTRTADTLIDLADRPALANRLGAGRPSAVFLSIHMNAATSPSVRGFETFFLSQARTEDERRVAEMENASVQFEDGPSQPLSEEEIILNGLRNDFYVRASNDLAEVVQLALGSVHTGPDRGVKRAGFRVLVGALMPAVLVEVGFISNAREAGLIADGEFQKKVALALADAVHRFFNEHEHLWTGGP